MERPGLPMRLFITSVAVLALSTIVSAQQTSPKAGNHASNAAQSYVGFDRNDYPGDDTLPAFRKQFSFAGYWLNIPPGARANTWAGKRDVLLRNGFGFLVLAN